MKVSNKNDIRTGMFGIMDNGMKFVIVDDLVVYKSGEFDDALNLTDDLKFHWKEIDKLFINCHSFNELEAWLESNNEKNCVYNRYAPIEMTIHEIEEALGITNLKIIK